MCCKCCGLGQRLFWNFGLGIIFLGIGLALLIVWPKFAKEIKEEKLVLKNGSEAYNNWKETPIPMYLSFYLFNWTNPYEIYSGVKPHLVQMGPYVYLEKDIKENITFNKDHTVSYFHRRVWHFQPELSTGTEQDMVTAAHAITATVADMIRHKNIVIKKVVNFMLNHEGGMLATTKSVSEWIFQGFDDRLIDFLKIFNSTKIDIPYNRFAWLADRNNSATYDGLFTINSGQEDISKMGSLELWNGSNHTGFYPAPCGTVNGTTGDLFPTNLNITDRISIYANDACRYLNLYPNGSLSAHGLTGTLWEGTEQTLDSGENFKSQECFCNKDMMDSCPLAGVVESKKCRNNAPIYASFPHFYLADKVYANGVTGLKPQRELHRFSLAVEPNLGIPLEVHARLQINLMLTPDDQIDIYSGIKQVLMPMFWFEQKAVLSEDLANRAKLALNLENYGRFAGIGLIAVGSIFLVIGIAMIVTHHRSRKDDDEDMLTTNVVEPTFTNAMQPTINVVEPTEAPVALNDS